jgi:hypothetical protein
LPRQGRGQQLAHALHQQAVAAVVQHRQGQGVLQHLAQGLLVAAQGQVQVAGVEVDGGARRVEGDGATEQHGVGIGMRRRVKRKFGSDERDARVHQPAGQPVGIAQHGDQAELAQRAQVAGLGDRQGGGVAAGW